MLRKENPLKIKISASPMNRSPVNPNTRTRHGSPNIVVRKKSPNGNNLPPNNLKNMANQNYDSQ